MQRLVGAGEREQGHAAGLARSSDQLLHRRQVAGHRARPRGGRGRRPGQIVDQPDELQLGEESARLRLVERPAHEVLQLHGHGKVVVELDELARPTHHFQIGQRVLAQLGPLDLACPRQHSLQRAELLEQRRGGLLADAGNAGDVVDLVAREGEQVGDQVRRDAPLLLDLGGAVPLLVHAVVAADAAVHELQEVLVAGDDHHFPPQRAGAARQSRDHVVGLPPRQSHRGHVERLEHPPHQRELRPQVLRRCAAGGFVLGVDLAARLFALLVERDGQVRRAPLADGPQQHGGEAVDGVGGDALAGREVRQRVVGAEDGVRAVDEPERGHL